MFPTTLYTEIDPFKWLLRCTCKQFFGYGNRAFYTKCIGNNLQFCKIVNFIRIALKVSERNFKSFGLPIYRGKLNNTFPNT